MVFSPPFASLEHLLGSPSSNVLPLTPHLLELHPDLVERLRDHRDEHVLHHPGQEEDHGDEVEGRLPWIKGVSCPVHDVDPALLAGSLVHGEHAGGKFSKTSETNLGPGAICQVHTFEALSASLAVVLFVVRIGVDPVTRVVNKLSSSKIPQDPKCPKVTIGLIGNDIFLDAGLPAIAVWNREIIDGDVL